MKPEEKRKKWQKLIKEFEGSNKSRKKWCEEKNLSEKALGYWYARYGKNSSSKYKVIKSVSNTEKKSEKNEDASTANWIEVILPESEDTKDIPITNLLKIQIGKAEIAVSNGFDKNLLKDVAIILGEIC